MTAKYVKLTNESCYHNGFQFREGLNVDTVSFSTESECCAGGIYFTRMEHFHKWLCYSGQSMMYCWDVIIPDDAKVHHYNTKSKEDRIILSNKRLILEMSELQNESVQIAAVQRTHYTIYSES